MLTAAAASVAQTAAVVSHWGGPGGGPFGGGFPWFAIVFPLFWIAVFVGLFIFTGRRRKAFMAHHEWNASAGARDAEKTLAERFAKGDIDETEFRARLEVLRANRPEPRTP